MKKSLPAAKKLAIVDILQTRARAGKATIVTYKDKAVDLKKVRRTMKEHARQQTTMRALNTTEAKAGITSEASFPAGNRMYEILSRCLFSSLTAYRILRFLSWNMPYGAMRRSQGPTSGGPSPSAMVASPPSDVGIATPSSAAAPSP